MRRQLVLAAVSLLAVSTQSFAADATADEAKRLVDVFHTYLGAPGAGEADRVSAMPEGEAYRMSIDVAGLASSFLAEGLTIEAPALTFLAEPLPDATWRVTGLTMPSPLTIRIPDQAQTFRWEGATFDGIYDPALATFMSFEHSIASSSSEMHGAQGDSTSFVGMQATNGMATDAGNGTVNMEMHQTMHDVVAQETIVFPGSGDKDIPAPPIEFAYSIENAAIDMNVEGLDAAGLLDLWASIVANAQTETPSVDAASLKAMLGALMPFFGKLDESVMLNGLRVGTPFGDFALQQAHFGLGLPGLVENGGLALSLAMSGPTYPAELIPSWAMAMAPTDVDITLGVSGFNLDAAARHLLASFDESNTPHLQNADWMAAGTMLLPDSGAKLILKPGHISGPMLDIAFEGEAALVAKASSATVKITVKGLDEAIAIVTEASSSDPMAMQALGMLSMAQMFGRPTDDGAMEFVIMMTPDRTITVNDQVVMPGVGSPT